MLEDILSEFEEPTRDKPIVFSREDKDYNSIINSSRAPRGYGVYLIMNEAPEIKYENILYIGMSGTYKKGEGIAGQDLRRRLKKKQEGLMRKDFFPQIMYKDGIEKIWIRCFITFDEDEGVRKLPANVEALLIQSYFEEKNCLPPWNNAF